ncbi:hypothetical protein ASE67_02690 [Sphingomonas sp. Leaf23]|nr:hypothetical protein ASE67_02690 [Sphingomonas sp. Leaf23]
MGALAIAAGGGSKPLITRASDGLVVAKIDVNSGFTGYAGTLTSGAGRVTIGTNTPTGDDSAIILTRAVVGDTHSHGVRDEGTVDGTVLNNAYASFDAVARVISASSTPVKLDHIRGFQARMLYDRAGALEEYNGFGSQANILQGSVGNLFDFHVQTPAVSAGATIQNHFGIRIDKLDKAVTNVGIFCENDCYFLGTVQIQGNLTGVVGMDASARVSGQDIRAKGTLSAVTANATVLIGSRGAASYGAVQGYGALSSGAQTTKGLALNPDGGQVLVGRNGVPVTGEAFEVGGTIGGTAYRVSGTKVVGAQGAAVADATDAASVITQLNALLSRLRAHGLIAT